MAGEQRVLELRQDGVLVAQHDHREERLAGLDRAMALRRSSSFTGTDVQPDSRSWPSVAGAGCEAVEVMAANLSPAPALLYRHARSGTVSAVRLRWFLDDDDDPGRHRRRHRAGQPRARSRRRPASDQVDRRAPRRPRARAATHRRTGDLVAERRRARSAAPSPPCTSTARCSIRARCRRRSPSPRSAASATAGGSPACSSTGRPRRSSGTPAARSCCRRAARSCSTRCGSTSRRRGCGSTSPTRVHVLTPGTYHLDTPVAVGTSGVAGARESVTFEAVDGSTFEAPRRRRARPRRGEPRHVLGPGKVHLEGTLELTDGVGHAHRSRRSTPPRARSTSPSPRARRRLDRRRPARRRRHRRADRSADRYPRCSMVELGGTWRAAVADDDLRRTWQDDGFDDDGWETVEVPGPLALDAAFADTDGPLLYRRRFEAHGPGRGPPRVADLRRPLLPGRRVARRRYLGDTEGYFVPHTFEVTDALRARGEHDLAVEVTCAPPARPDRQAQPHRRLPALGLPRPRLEPRRHLATGARRRDRARCASRGLRVLCREATAERAVLVLRATLDSDAARTVSVHTALGERRPRAEQPLAAGENHVEWTVTVDRPDALVAARARRPTLHDVHVDVVLDADRGRRARPTRATSAPGCGRSRLRNWIARVNGERLFLKGSNHGPDAHGARRGHARGAGRRRRAGAATPASTCCASTPTSPGPSSTTPPTRPGCSCGRTSRCSGATPGASASRPCARPRAAVDLLGHHPSIAIWCGHNEPMAIENDPRRGATRRRCGAWRCRRPSPQELPTWNKTVLDRSVKRALEKADGTRPVIAHSRRAPPPAAARRHRQPPLLRLVPRRRARLPRLPPRRCRAWPGSSPSSAPRPCPTDRRLLRARAVARPRLGAARRARTRCRGRCSTGTCRPPTTPPSTSGAPPPRRTRPTVVRRHIEALRRIKYRPDRRLRPVLLRRRAPGGHLVGARPRPGAEGRLRRAARGVPAGDRRRRPAAGARHAPGEALALDVHVVSDLRAQLDDAEVTAALHWTGGSRTWRWRGDIPADGCAARRHRADRRARRARARSRSSSTAGTATSRSTTATRRRSLTSTDLTGFCGFQTDLRTRE